MMLINFIKHRIELWRKLQKPPNCMLCDIKYSREIIRELGYSEEDFLLLVDKYCNTVIMDGIIQELEEIIRFLEFDEVCANLLYPNEVINGVDIVYFSKHVSGRPIYKPTRLMLINIGYEFLTKAICNKRWKIAYKPQLELYDGYDTALVTHIFVWNERIYEDRRERRWDCILHPNFDSIIMSDRRWRV